MTTRKKQRSEVDQWLSRETPRVREALEKAARQFKQGENLTVHTLEAIYGKESSFGILLREPGMDGAAGHFHLEKDTAKRFGLEVSKGNDQRFNLELASSAAAKYLKVLNKIFSGKAKLSQGKEAVSIQKTSELKKFIRGAYNAGEGYVVRAQYLAANKGKNPRLWNDVWNFIEAAGAEEGKNKEARNYVEEVLLNEAEFASKSRAGKKTRQRKIKQSKYRCSEDEGRWRTIDDRPVLICDKKTV